MSLDPASGYAAPSSSDSTALPIFDVQNVQLRFDISAPFVAAQVANNVLILALSTNRLLRFDLDNAADIDDIDLPKRPAEIGVVRRLFLDPSASHLIISTTLGENFYLHTQSRQVKALGKLKGRFIDCVGWNPACPTSSTREILLGSSDGSVYETYIEPHTEFYRSQERFVERVVNFSDGPVSGIWVEALGERGGREERRRVVVSTQTRLWHFSGRVPRLGEGGGGSVYARFFEGETPAIHEIEKGEQQGGGSGLSISPDSPEPNSGALDAQNVEKVFAWLSQNRVFTGTLLRNQLESPALGREVFREAEWVEGSRFSPSASQNLGGLTRRQSQQQPSTKIESLLLTQFHIVVLSNGRITAMNRLDKTIVYNQQVLEKGQTCLGLFADHQKNTFWAFSSNEIFEIVVTDETRDVWRILLGQGQYEQAQRYAKTAEQRDAVASMTGDHLMSQGRFEEAAALLGRSTKAFEDVSLSFIDKGEHDALRKYLLVKLSTLKKSSIMQRVMLSTWLVELYMAKLNDLDDTISTKAELTNGTASSAREVQDRLPVVRKEFQDFVSRYRGDLDRKAVYEIISSHGREEELLHFANVVNDYDYVMSYWVQRERWDEAMRVLQKQTDPDMFYRYGTVLMAHVPMNFVDVLMRQGNLDAKKLIPAMLNYNKVMGETTILANNVAIRYLRFCIEHGHSTEPAVHNTLISLYASHPSQDEAVENALLTYLQTQENAGEQNYDADFALRLCIAHKRVKSCVHIYRSMSQYIQAVDLALKHGDIDTAKAVTNSPDHLIAPPLRKKLWLQIAKKVISQSQGIKAAMSILRDADPLLHIEDLIPLFPDFIIIDDFKEEICAALEDYSRKIDSLKQEMDESALTAQHIKQEISSLDQRYAIVEPGEKCWKCRLPLLMRQFFVFPCQHAFHADCLGEMVLSVVGTGREKRIRELQREIGRGVALGGKREGMVKELDGLVAGSCVLCSDLAVRMVDEPFIKEGVGERERREWAV